MEDEVSDSVDIIGVRQAADAVTDWCCFEDFIDSEFTPTVAAYLADVEPKKVLALLDKLARYETVVDAARKWRADEQTEPATQAEDALAEAVDALGGAK
jgi:hypothetical protein